MDVQFLAGVAVTVFLALLFFGVVVLWDVALALRSVGDKIDKLEDNLDDDLVEIGHALDGISNARGSGGGTQLHLSGGTISSGPASNQGAAHEEPRREPQQDGQYRRQQRRTERPPEPQASGADGHAEPHAERPPEPHSTAADRNPQQEGNAEAEPDDVVSDGADEPNEESSSEDEAGAASDSAAEPDDAEPDGSNAEEVESEASDATADDGTEAVGSDDAEPDPRAERNRGRFVTASGVTPWYLTPLDREAIADAQPEIAGELAAADEPTGAAREDPIVAGPASEDDIESGAPGDLEADGAGVGTISSDVGIDADSSNDAESTDDATVGGGKGAATPMPSDPDPKDGAADDDEGAVISYDETDTVDASDAAGDAQESSPEDPVASPDTLESASSPEPVDAAETEPESLEAGGTDDAPDVGFGDLSDLGRSSADEGDVTVEDAVDTLNDDAPSLSLSSHDFDVVAEADDDGAVLIFEFDPSTVALTGSTKRLLRYQLHSFADEESTPEGDVRIEGQTIVVEIPDPKGDDVQRWGEAAVTIIDRTLYLSDNSS